MYLCGIVFSEIVSPALGKSFSPGDEEEVSLDPSQFVLGRKDLTNFVAESSQTKAMLAELVP